MPTIRSRPTRVRIKKRRQRDDVFKVRRSFWDLRLNSLRKTAVLGFLAGTLLGSLFGATLAFFPGGARGREAEMLSVNQNTGKPQLHIKGKPEIK